MKKLSTVLLIVMVLALAITAFGITAGAEATATTNSSLYIGEYETSSHSGLAHIVFGTVSDASVEYGIIITQEDGKQFKFPGKNIGSSGKFGVAIYNLPEGKYTACAYSGSDDNRITGEPTAFEEGVSTYTVTLDYNGATGYDESEVLVAQGAQFEAPDMTNVSLAGANFVKWVDENGDEYDFTKVVDKNVTLSAIYESKYGMDMPMVYTTTGAQFFGVNQNVNVGFGGTAVWQFDVLAYENASQAIRMVVGSATAASGNAMQYKPAFGEAASVMGFTAANGQDWYGGDYGKSGNKSTVFSAGKTYRLEYIAPTAQYAKDGSFKLYVCDTANVGTANETWDNTFYLKNVGNVEGGNQFAPITSVNLNVYFGGKDVKFATVNNSLTVNGTPYKANMEYTGTCDWDYAPYVVYSSAKRVTINGDGLIGNLSGFDIGFGGSIAWQFDVKSITYNSSFWYFGATEYTETGIISAPANIRYYKSGYNGQCLGFYTATAQEYFGGTSRGTTRNANSTFASGYTYKYVYTAATSTTGGDGSAILYECPTAFVGTALESWTEILYNRGIDGSANTFNPTSSVKVGLFVRGTLDMVMDNSTIVAKNASGAVISSTTNNATAGAATIESLEYSAPKTQITVDISNTAGFGFVEDGIDLDYGESIVWTYDVVSSSPAPWIAFFVTSNDVKANVASAMSYKDGYCSNRFVFTATSYDYLGGTHAGKRTASTAIRAGYSYKFIYTAPSAADANDGFMALYECEPGTLGQANEAWNLCASLSAFGNNNGNGNSFAPTENVKLGIYAQNGAMSVTFDNMKITLPDGSVLTAPFWGSQWATIS